MAGPINRAIARIRFAGPAPGHSGRYCIHFLFFRPQRNVSDEAKLSKHVCGAGVGHFPGDDRVAGRHDQYDMESAAGSVADTDTQPGPEPYTDSGTEAQTEEWLTPA